MKRILTLLVVILITSALFAPIARALPTDIIVERMSVSTEGNEGNRESSRPSISGWGRYVAFQSFATNLVSNDINDYYDIYIRDRAASTTIRITWAYDGADVDGSSFTPRISASGRYVVYESSATNLVPGDTNNDADIFVYDRDTDGDGIFDEPGATLTSRVSVASDGSQGSGGSARQGNIAAISADGRYVVFHSHFNNLVASDTNNSTDVFVHDMQTGATLRLSTSAAGGQADNHSYFPSISADGRYVTFTSYSGAIVSGDNNNYCDTDGDFNPIDNCPDIFRYDRDADEDGIFDEPGEVAVALVSVGLGGVIGDDWSDHADISADGRYVAFESDSTNLVASDVNDQRDVFLRDMDSNQTVLVSVSTAGVQGDDFSSLPAITADGHYIAFHSAATTLVTNDFNNAVDIFLRDTLLNTTERASLTFLGNESNGASTFSDISAYGEVVTFDSLASFLVPGDTNGMKDIFVRVYVEPTPYDLFLPIAVK